LRIPLEAYLQDTKAKVYSLVVDVPFSPLDIDLGHLARVNGTPLRTGSASGTFREATGLKSARSAM